VRAQVVADPDQGLHLDEVHEALVGLGDAYRDLYGGGVGAQFLHDGVGGHVEVGADAVHLVDVGDAGHAVAVGLAPHGLALGLHALHAVEHGHGAVEHAQRALNLGGKVHVAGGVDDVDGITGPLGADGGGGDGYAALALLGHPVGGGGAVVHLADLVLFARIIKDALGGGGFTSVDVGDDSGVAYFTKVEFCHIVLAAL